MLTINPSRETAGHSQSHKKIKILHLEDSPSDADLVDRVLRKARLEFELLVVDTKETFIKALKTFCPDIILADHSLPAFDSFEALSIVYQSSLKIPFVLVTATMPDEFAASIIKRGADEYILKDRLSRLPIAINNVMEKYRLENEKKIILGELVKNEKRFRSLIENSTDGIIILSEEGKPFYASASVEKILGYSVKEVLHMFPFADIHPDDLPAVADVMKQALDNPGVAMREHIGRMRHKDGSWRWIEATITNMLHDPSIKGIVNNFSDITPRKQAEARLIHVNRLYDFLSQVNKAIVFSADEQSLFEGACRIAVEQGKFKMAWIGVPHAPGRIHLSASFGQTNDDILKLDDYLYDVGGPIDKTLKGGEYVVINDLQKDPGITWKEYAAERGFNAVICLAIKIPAQGICVLTIYSSEIDFFSDEEISLLREAALDISKALVGFEKDRLRTTAEQNLKNSELKLKQAQAIAHLGNWDLVFSTGKATWSEEALRMYGLPTDEREQTFDSWISFIHPDDLDFVNSRIAEAQAGSGNSSFFHRILRKDGSVRHIHSESHLQVNDEGTPIGMYGVAHDVTDIKNAEASLRESKSNLQAIFENTPNGFILTDLEGYIKSFNNKAREIYYLNVKKELVKGNSIFDYSRDSMREVYRSAIPRVLAGENVQYDLDFVRENGEEKWFTFTIDRVHNNEWTEGFSISINDITGRKKAEAGLQESELFNKGILASLHSHIAVIDRTGIIITVNKAWNDFAIANGVTTLERASEGSNYFDVCRKAAISGDSIANQVLDGIRSVFEKEVDEFQLEYPCHSLTDKRWFILHVSNFGKDSSKIVLSHQNITERKIAEQRSILSEAKLIEAQAVSKIGSWETDLLTMNVFWSAEIFRIFEINPNDFIPTHARFLDFIHPDDREKVDKAFTASLNKTTHNSIEHRIVTPTGKIKFVEEHWQIYQEENGLPGRAAGTCQDITQRREIEQLLQRSEANLKAIIENTDASIYSIDSNFRYLTFNTLLQDTLKAIYGLDVKPGDNVYDFLEKLNPEEAREWELVYSKALDGQIVKFEKEFSINDYYSYISFSIYPIWENQEVIGLSCFAFDITKQKLAEKEQEQTELRYRQIVETAQEGIWLIDENSRTTFVNNKMCEILGYAVEEMIGKEYTYFMGEVDVDEATASIERRKRGITENLDQRFISKSGKEIWATVSANPFLDNGGNYKGALAMVTDITDKKALKDLLDKTNKLADIGTWDIDVTGGIVFWSDKAKEIQEADPGFVPQLSTGIHQFQKGSNNGAIPRRVQDCMEKGIPWDEELEILTQKGNLKWIRSVGEAEFMDGKCVRIYGSFQDIDMRKRAELEVLKIFQEKNTVLESIRDGFFAVDKNWVVTYWNKEAEKVFHKHKHEIIGKNFWDVFSDSIDSESFRKYHQAIELNRVMVFEDHYASLSKWYEISAYPSEKGLSVYFKDVSERKISELEFKKMNSVLEEHARELAISNQELEQFAYVASHDLQEPLRMVTGFMTQLQKKYGDVIGDKGKQYINFAVDGAKRMRHIILDLLEFSKAGKAEDKLEKVDLNGLMEEVLTLYHKQIEAGKVDIRVGNLPLLITFRTPVSQLFQNLVSNSLKYAKEGTAAEITISAKEIGTHWQFAVSDNGIGIDPQYFDKVFVIFQRLHNKEEYSGTGIGLAICKKIVENLGGKIWVESEEGKGSTFYFTLPK
ncbi:MAG: PAS domain S-box protein [Chitinophagaceae bacterium]